MKPRVLGSCGGRGGELRTRSLLLDHTTQIDAGAGVSDISINGPARIDHVFEFRLHVWSTGAA